MRIEKKQVKLVDDWNAKHPVGIDVIVTKDDGTEQRTRTRSAAWMLGASGEYPGHTAVIMLDGISGCYALDRVREAISERDEKIVAAANDILEYWEKYGES